MKNNNNSLVNDKASEAYCYVIDLKGNLLSKISFNKGFVYLRKQKASFFNRKPFIIQLDKIIENPINDLSTQEKDFLNKVIQNKLNKSIFNGGRKMDKKEKLRAMNNAIKHLEKTTKKTGVAYRLGDKPVEKIATIPTGALPLDIALGCGGWPRGRIIELYGEESSGKTLMASKAIAECQKQDGICAMIDMEHAFDPDFAAKLGVNIDDLFISQPEHLQECFTVIDKFVDAGCDLIVLDSIATLVPKEELEGEVGKQTIGLVARYMGQFLRRIGPKLSLNNVCLICINQTRDKLKIA